MKQRIVRFRSLGQSVHGQMVRLFADESGDDLIEYALLTSLIGMVGVTAFNFLNTAILRAYVAWDGNIGNLWESPPPAP